MRYLATMFVADLLVGDGNSVKLASERIIFLLKPKCQSRRAD